MRVYRISEGENPPADRYVLIKVRRCPWMPKEGAEGVDWKVAKCVYDFRDLRRRPFYFSEFGGGDFFEEEVDLWCELPPSDEEKSRKQAGAMHILSVATALFTGGYIIYEFSPKKKPAVKVFQAVNEMMGETENKPIGEITIWQLNDLVKHHFIEPVDKGYFDEDDNYQRRYKSTWKF